MCRVHVTSALGLRGNLSNRYWSSKTTTEVPIRWLTAPGRFVQLRVCWGLVEGSISSQSKNISERLPYWGPCYPIQKAIILAAGIGSRLGPFTEHTPKCLAPINSVRVRSDRDNLYFSLAPIPGMIAYKPDANYIFCRLPEEALSDPEVTRRLFIEHDIYIKHCAGKPLPEPDRYLRIASRTKPENHKLVEALRSIITKR